MLTVVLKLLQIVRPDRVFFGEKDYQQLVLVRQMVADLNVDTPGDRCADRARIRRPGDVVTQPLPRSPMQRELAGVLSAALLAGCTRAASGGADTALAAARAVLSEIPAIDVEYLQVRDPELGPAPA